MKNNDSPYVYEKPLRAKGAKFTKAITAFGLVVFGTVIGCGAFANSVETEAEPHTTQPVIATGKDSDPDETMATQVESAGDSHAGLGSAIIALLLVQQTTKKNSSAIVLPDPANQSYGNTSSATPYAGGSHTGSNLASYQEHEEDDEDSDEDHED